MDLIPAVVDGDIIRVRELLDSGEDPNTREHYTNRTALMIASEYGHTEIIRLLLDRGADPNSIGIYGRTALMIAESEGNDDITRLIRDHIGLQKARQRLAFATRLLGDDNDLDYDTMTNVMSKPRRYDPSINIRMMDERRRDKLTKARQRLASMRSMYSREGPISTVRYDPSIMEGISRHLSRMRPVPSVQTRLMLEDKDKKGGSKQSSRSSSRKKKNYTRRTRFFQ